MKAIPVRQISKTGELNYTGRCNIRRIEDLLKGQQMVQALHRHNFFYLLVLEKGSGKHTIDFTSYEVANHTVFFLRPGQVHELVLAKGSKGYLLVFDKLFYAPQQKSVLQIFQSVSNKNYCRLNARKFSRMLAILDYMFDEHLRKAYQYEEVIKASLSIFFIELARHKTNESGHGNETGLYNQQRLDELYTLLERHIHSKKHVSDYAHLMHLSLFQINAICKKGVGRICSALITDQIILEAKRQLLATTLQVAQIANELGYEDVSYFIRFFKKNTGYTPEVFRQKHV